MQESILLIEDEEHVAQFIELELQHEGYRVEVAQDGEQGWELAQQNCWDLILLDWMLPKLDGLEICRRIRKSSSVPIILLTARDYKGDKVAGLDTGADDYVTKPFDIEELLARIRAVLRRNKIADADQDILQLLDLTIDVKQYRVTRNGKPIELTGREFDLLLFMMKHQGQVLSRDTLLSAVWSFDYAGETNIVDVYIRYLRNKVDRGYNPKLIQTIRGVGYVLRPSE